MKTLMYIFLALAAFSMFVSCEEELRDPKLDISKAVKSQISNPADGSAFVLLKENADSLFATFEWSATQYNLTNLEDTKYILQMDMAGNNFADALDLVSTVGANRTFNMNVTEMNKILIGVLELDFGVEHQMEFRIRAYLNDFTDYSEVYSDVNTLTITPYDDQVYIKPIYLLGGATTIGWDNTIALPMGHLGEGRFARVESLDPAGTYIKFISVIGQWAPQWGTDATGTPESGPLVYRPDEGVPDPAAIPVAATAGDYYIEADTLNLMYKTFLTSGELFLIGDATSAGWDNTAGLPLTEGPDHVFTIVTNLAGSGNIKFLEVSGQWAPQWGTNDKGTAKRGTLAYRPTESVPDPPSIPGPATAGQYKITVDLTTMQYLIEEQ